MVISQLLITLTCVLVEEVGHDQHPVIWLLRRLSSTCWQYLLACKVLVTIQAYPRILEQVNSEWVLGASPAPRNLSLCVLYVVVLFCCFLQSLVPGKLVCCQPDRS